MLGTFASWAARISGFFIPRPAFRRLPWSAFADPPADAYERAVPPQELVDLAAYRKEERTQACHGADPLRAIPAYAQDALIYTADNRLAPASPEAYAALPAERKVNKFGQAYRSGAPLLLHRHLADILVDAAVDLHRSHGWSVIAFDGLRTMESAYLLYRLAQDQWLRDGLLSSPGRSAHNRALAVDCSLFDARGREVPMGGHFDHADMESNHRHYRGPKITAEEAENRLVRERAMMRAALARGTVIAPLREEFWDDRAPGSPEDLWRVIESLCRCLGQEPPDARARDYPAFARQWETYLDKSALLNTFGDYALHPPAPEAIVYHERLKPIYDRDLPMEMRQAAANPAEQGH